MLITAAFPKFLFLGLHLKFRFLSNPYPFMQPYIFDPISLHIRAAYFPTEAVNPAVRGISDSF
jgi:hypothetical protein